MSQFRILAAAACMALLGAGPILAQSAPSEIDVLLTNFAFAPDTITLHAGTTYKFHLVNNGTSSHNFAAPDFFAVATVAPADAGKVKDGAIEAAKGQTVDVTVTPNKAGSYDLKCTHFMHTTFGMTGTITVQ
jgi:plastocyanin